MFTQCKWFAMHPSVSLLMLLFSLQVSIAYCSELPHIDWQALQQSKPWTKSEEWRNVPQVKLDEQRIPSDAIRLDSLHSWQKAQLPTPSNMEQAAAYARLVNADYQGEPAHWKLVNGHLQVTSGRGPIATKQAFGSIQLHIEWMTPKSHQGLGQADGNSGVFLMGLYEVQILNSYENSTYSNGQAGSIYKQKAPIVNASLPPETWQSYDIIFHAPKFDDSGALLSPAILTVLHNGVLIQDHVELIGPTVYFGESRYAHHPEKLPLVLQEHGAAVSFRNIWIREL